MTSGSAAPDDAEQLKTEIEQTRDQLGQTAEQLVAKADVKARAQAKISELRQRAKDATSQARRRAAAQAGGARSQLVEKYQASGSLQQTVTKGLDGAKARRKPLLIAVGVLAAGAVVIRIWRRR